MSADMSLFGDDESVEGVGGPPSLPSSTPAPRWQLDLIRKALDAHGFYEMTQRQAAVEQLIGRPVQTLSELTPDEAYLVLNRLPKPQSKVTTKSEWDEREEPTWIDQM